MIAMQNCCSFLFLTLFFCLNLFSQEVTVYQDNFSNSTSNTSGPYTGSVNGVSPNNSKWHYTETDGGWSVAHQFASSEMRLVNNYNTDDSYGTAFLNKRLGGSLSPIGSDGVYGTYQTSNPNFIKDNFTTNTQNLEWTFLFYISHSTHMGLSNGLTYYGGAFILGSEYNNITMCSTSLRNKGYAVVFASSNIQLVKFTSGTNLACAPSNYPQYLLNNTYTYNSNSCVISDNSNSLVGGRWYAVKVQYNPSNDQWRLFTRHNVTSSFDPTTLVSADGRGAAVDNTYTNNYLAYMGLYASLPPDNATYGPRSVRIKNLKIKKNVSLISTAAGSGVCSGIVALPVELKSFTSTCESDQIGLNWITYNERNVEKYEILRSFDGLEFQKIEELFPYPSSFNYMEYSFSDFKYSKGINYYRLIQVDNDGFKKELGTISQLGNCNSGSVELSVFPNPANDRLNIYSEHTDLNAFRIKLLNALGQDMLPDIKSFENINGMKALFFSTQSLIEGVYLLVFTDEKGIVQVCKVLIQH